MISLLLNYYPSDEHQKGTDSFKLSKYAYGTDYHFVIKDKFKELLRVYSGVKLEMFTGRHFVDSAPVLDKVWAAKSGLGWMGKHSNLLTQQIGSFYFIAELIVDLELEYDGAVPPIIAALAQLVLMPVQQQAIVEPYVVDGSKCISYFTIELKRTNSNRICER